MMRLKRILLLAFLLFICFGTMIFATYDYDYPITISDTSGSARTYYPVNLGFSAQTLIDRGEINSNCLNTDLQIGGSTIKYMMDTTRVMAVIPSLPANGNTQLHLFTDNSVAQTGFPIIVGDGGYITTLDNAAIELGSNFAVEIDGYFDTSAGTNKNIFVKSSAIQVYISAADTVTVAVTGLAPISWAMTSGDHVVKVYTSGGNIVLNIDSSDDTSVGVGAGVPNTTTDYIWNQNDTMPYIDFIKVTVGGVEVVKYQPNTALISTAVVNRDSGGSYGGVITWGTNDDIDIHYDVAIGTGVSGTLLTPPTGSPIPTSAMPSTWFANGENAANLPFYDSFSDVASQVGMPIVVFYFWAAIGFAFGVFLLLVMFTRSALLGAVGFNVVLFIGSSMTVVPMWIPFVCLIVMLGIMYLYREVAY